MTTVRVVQILMSVLEGSPTVSDLPHRLVVGCARALSVSGVALALTTDAGCAGTVAISDEPAAEMENLQFTLGEGPCVECSVTGRPVLTPDLRRIGPGQWPVFAAGALEAGVRAVFALPLRVGGMRFGALALYCDEVRELTAEQLVEALAFADAATALLLHLLAQPPLDGRGLGAVPMVDDRAEVHQATGAITVQAGIHAPEALSRLRARAYATDRPILDLARDVLAGGVSFESAYDRDDYGGDF